MDGSFSDFLGKLARWGILFAFASAIVTIAWDRFNLSSADEKQALRTDQLEKRHVEDIAEVSQILRGLADWADKAKERETERLYHEKLCRKGKLPPEEC